MSTGFNKTKQLNALLLLGAIVSLSACVSNPTLSDAAALEPLALSQPEVGRVLNFVDTVSGDVNNWTVTAIDGDWVTSVDQDDCSWTNSGDPIEPSLNWSNCGSGQWSTGGIKDSKKKGNLWPLAVGNKVSYSQRFYNSTGDEASNKSTKRCKVKSIDSVDLSGTLVDAFRVVCTQDYGDKKTRSYWFAPGKGLVGYNVSKSRRLVRTF